MRMRTDTRTEIAEKVHNIMDLLRDSEDRILTDLCERMLDRLDALAEMKEDNK